MSRWLDQIKYDKAEVQYGRDKRAEDRKILRNKRIRESNARAEKAEKRGPIFAPYQDKVAEAKRKVKRKQKAAEKRSYYGG